MAKRLNENSVLGLVGTASSEWIKEVNDGSKTHAVAVKNGITFFNGKSDTSGVIWDGVQELEVVIPTLADIVSNPVVLKGIANADADLPSAASNGDLYYIGTAGTYKGEVCEAGDMAICYNSTWHFIQGENQVSLASNALALGKTAQDAITVEGQTLTLAVDYDDVRSNTKVTKSATQTLNVSNGTVTVAPTYLGLTQADGTTVTVATSAVSIDLPTALASNAVTISDKVLVSGDFTWDAGSFPTISKNAAAINVNATHNMSISKATETDGTTGDYITSVVAIKSAQLAAGSAGNGGTAYVTGLTAASGHEFVSGIHVYDSQNDGPTADLTIPGAVTAASANNTFATGWNTEAASGEVVSSITVGAVTGDFVTGLSGGGNSVLTGVTFGDAELDTTKNWFVTGLSGDASPITAVSFGEVVVTPTTSSAMVSASVSDHVLSFTTGTFMTSAAASLSGTGTTSGTFTKGGVKLSGFDSASASLVTGSVSQATTTISYKSLATAAVTLTQGSASEYAFNKDYEHTYTADSAYLTISTTDATFTKNTPVLTNTTLSVTIPADTVAVDVTGGTLPSLTISAPTGTISGTVGTALTTSSVSWLGVASNAQTITIPGAVSLGVVASDAEGAVAVAAADTYSLASGTVTVPSGFVTDVFVDGTAVGVSTGA